MGVATAVYDQDGYIYRGRIITRHPGHEPDGVWSCPGCGALVIDQDRGLHTESCATE